MDKRESVPSYCQVLKFKDANGQVKEMIFPKALDLDRPKRPRTTFSEAQLSTLENEFQQNPYLIGKDRTKLAADLGLSETQVKVWFQNRRTKSKRSKTGGDQPPSPEPPSSNNSNDPPQTIPDSPTTFLDKSPSFEQQQIEPLEPKRGFTNFNIDHLNVASPNSPISKPAPPFVHCPPPPTDFPSFAAQIAAPPFSEFMPMAAASRQHTQFSQAPFFGGAPQPPNGGSWAAPLWFPWSAPCLPVKPASSE